MKVQLFLFVFFTLLSVQTSHSDDQVMLAKTFANHNVKGWFASEKLDGVRGIWTGHQMQTRSGLVLSVSSEFTHNFPPFELDGELYIGIGTFDQVSGQVRSGKDWSNIHYHVFDVPSAQGGLLARLSKLERWLKTHPTSRIKIIPQIRIEGIEEAKRLLHQVEQKGGEGLILRDPLAPYVSKRTDTMLKLKSYQDAECIVRGYTPGQGKYVGKMGAIICELPTGAVIKIGSGFSDIERTNPPSIGQTITYRYNGLTSGGKPRFARFWRVRPPL